MSDKRDNAKRTAAEAYKRRQADIAAMMDWLGMELEKHAEKAKDAPRDWGMVGDLGLVRQHLLEALAFLSGFQQSTIEETLADNHDAYDNRS